MINFSKLLSFPFWFRLSPPPLTMYSVRLLVAFFGATLVISVVSGTMAKVKIKHNDRWRAKMWERLRSAFLTMGILGLLITWSGYEGAALLSARFWYPVWFLILISWVGLILYYTKKKAPASKGVNVELRLKQKYLP